MFYSILFCVTFLNWSLYYNQTTKTLHLPQSHYMLVSTGSENKTTMSRQNDTDLLWSGQSKHRTHNFITQAVNGNGTLFHIVVLFNKIGLGLG